MAMNLLMIGALPFGVLRTEAIRDYANAAIPVAKREGLTKALQAYTYVATRPGDSTALDFLKQADITATAERAAKGIQARPATTQPSGNRSLTVDADGNAKLSPQTAPPPPPPAPETGLMGKIKEKLGPHGPLLVAGSAGLLLLLLLVPKKRA